MAKKREYSTEKSAVSHRKCRAKLRRLGLCLWNCGTKAAPKPGGGRFILCKDCMQLQKERYHKAQAAAKELRAEKAAARKRQRAAQRAKEAATA